MNDANPFHPNQPAITAEMVLAECKRELAQRRRFYPKRIDEGRMTEAEANLQLAIAAAWAEDVSRIISFELASAQAWANFRASNGRQGMTLTHLAPATHAVTWRDRRTGIGRELDLRSRVYPRRIEQGQMTISTGQHQTACLSALAERYDDGFDWTDSNGHRPHFAQIHTTPEIEHARKEWANHQQAVNARRKPAQQKELLA